MRLRRPSALQSAAFASLLLVSCAGGQAEDRSSAAPRMEHASALRYVVLSPQGGREALPIRDAARLAARLDEVKAEGFSGIHVVSPADGGASYGGLDTTDHYAIRPEAGGMDDFRRLMREAHRRGLAVTISYNLGYASVDAPFWLKACDDVREGRDSAEARWFLWAPDRDAPRPPGDSVFNPPGPGFWEYSARARRYFWTRWGGDDKAGVEARLPQYDWSRPEFRQEAERILRFWMNTGIDGMMLDAVNWYNGIDWKENRRITSLMSSFGHVWLQPEGAGGFAEDPVAWITEGHWNSIQDYGLGTWWVAGSSVLAKAFQTGDPRPIETALHRFHDRVRAAGGTLFSSALRLQDPVVPSRTQAPHLAAAAMVAIGEVIGYDARDLGGPPDAEVQWLLRLKQNHPALQQMADRRQVPTNADEKFYAFVRTAPAGGDRILVVLNFRRGFQDIAVDLAGVANGGLVELKTGEEIPPAATLRTHLYSYGYRFYQVKAPVR